MKKFTTKTCVLLAIALTGFLLWHQRNSYQTSAEWVFPGHFIAPTMNNIGGSSKTTTQATDGSSGEDTVATVASFKGAKEEDEGDEEELITLIHKKLKDLKDAGMLRNITMRNCTSHEQVRNKCVDTNCTKILPENTSKENVRSILTPLRKVGRKKLREAIDAFALKPTGEKYTIITGASSNHFGSVQAAIKLLHKNVFPHLGNFTFYFYDLGLNEQQRMLVRNFPGAELRKFPFDKFSSSTRYLKCYLWKPLIILAHLQVTEFLVWLDATIAYDKPMNSYLKTLATTGILSTPNTYQMAQHCSRNFFRYFGDEACQFSVYDEIQGGHLLLHNEPFTQRLLLEPWAACALDPDCMCPPETRKMRDCPSNIRKYSKCHRYDQSAITLLMAKVFREHVASAHIQNPIHTVQQRQGSNFLKDLAKKDRKQDS